MDMTTNLFHSNAREMVPKLCNCFSSFVIPISLSSRTDFLLILRANSYIIIFHYVPTSYTFTYKLQVGCVSHAVKENTINPFQVSMLHLQRCPLSYIKDDRST